MLANNIDFVQPAKLAAQFVEKLKLFRVESVCKHKLGQGGRRGVLRRGPFIFIAKLVKNLLVLVFVFYKARVRNTLLFKLFWHV